jgi:flavorubredoxin
MRAFLNVLNIKAYQKRRVALVENGSWAPTAGRVMRQYIEGFKDVELVEPMVTIKSTLKEENIEQLKALAEELIK